MARRFTKDEGQWKKLSKYRNFRINGLNSFLATVLVLSIGLFLSKISGLSVRRKWYGCCTSLKYGEIPEKAHRFALEV
jgi:hypothetical protein